jgi:hypothetical protein
MDNGLGHLDLGQFEAWSSLPSVCFAAALIPRFAWECAGALDEKFPLYYEDSEWSYRARLFGLQLRAAPQAVVYHAFSARVPSGAESGLAPRKLRQVAFGRLRWITRLLGPGFLLRFLLNYLLEDFLRACLALLRGRGRILGAYAGAWTDYLAELPSLRAERRELQLRRAVSDRDLFRIQVDLPAPLVWHGLPLLTWDAIRYQYLPLLASRRTRPLAEFPQAEPAGPEQDVQKAPPTSGRTGSWVERARDIWAAEGWRGLAHNLGRRLQWRLMQP